MDYAMRGVVELVSAGTGEMKKHYGLIYVDKDDQGNGTLARSKKRFLLLVPEDDRLAGNRSGLETVKITGFKPVKRFKSVIQKAHL